MTVFSIRINSPIMVLCFFILTSCGGGSGSEETGNSQTDTNTTPENTSEPTDETDNSATSNESQSDAENNANPSTIALLSRNCGASVSNITASSNQDSPGTLFSSQVGTGTISGSTEDGVDTNNFWAFDVPEGSYILVVDAKNADNKDTNIGLRVTPTKLSSATGEILYRTNEIRRRLRHADLVTKTGDGPAGLRIQSVFGAMDYHIALYPVSEAVPIPFLSDCPSFRVTSAETTEAFELDQEINTSEWFIAELEPGSYDVVVDAAIVSGSATNLGFKVLLTNRLNDIDSEIELAYVNEIDTNFRAVGGFEVFEDSTVVNISTQINNYTTNHGYTMDLTIRKR